jgi:hypothetical protein
LRLCVFEFACVRLRVSTSPVCLHFTGPFPLRRVFSPRSCVLCLQIAFVFSLRSSVLTSPSAPTSLVCFHFAGVLPLRLTVSTSAVCFQFGCVFSFRRVLRVFISPERFIRLRVPFRSCASIAIVCFQSGWVFSLRLSVFILLVCSHFGCLFSIRFWVFIPLVCFVIATRLRVTFRLCVPFRSCVSTAVVFFSSVVWFHSGCVFPSRLSASTSFVCSHFARLVHLACLSSLARVSCVFT